VEEITTSVEGLVGGSSVPGQPKNLGRDFIQSKLHRWKSTNSSINGGGDGNPLDKGKHVPHIKTYYQIDNDHDNENEESMRWFVISSHNLSKPAWGEIQNREGEDKLTIQSWELGVFVSPKTLGVDSMGPILSSTNVNNGGYTLGGNSSVSLFPPNQQQQLMREQRLARFGGDGTPQQPQPEVISSLASLPPPPEDNSMPRATTDKRAATAAPIINQNNKQQRSRSMIPIPYKFFEINIPPLIDRGMYHSGKRSHRSYVRYCSFVNTHKGMEGGRRKNKGRRERGRREREREVVLACVYS